MQVMLGKLILQFVSFGMVVKSEVEGMVTLVEYWNNLASSKDILFHFHEMNMQFVPSCLPPPTSYFYHPPPPPSGQLCLHAQ
jgi:hypothetical protein